MFVFLFSERFCDDDRDLGVYSEKSEPLSYHFYHRLLFLYTLYLTIVTEGVYGIRTAVVVATSL